jgi:hypothetical protein
MASSNQAQTGTSITPPHYETMKHASILAIKQDKPIMMDYYAHSQLGRCSLKKTTEQDTILFKSADEYTSPLKKVFKIDKSLINGKTDVIAISENSIYVVHSNIFG